MEWLCTYFVGMVVTFFVLPYRHHFWVGMNSIALRYGLGFFLIYMFRTALPMVLLWPISLVIWAVRGFPSAQYDFRLAPGEAKAQGKRAP